MDREKAKSLIFPALFIILIFAPRLIPLIVLGAIIYFAFLKKQPWFQDFKKGFYGSRNVIDHNKVKTINPTKMMDRIKLLSPKKVLAVLGIIIAILIILDGFVSIPAGHVGVVFDQGRGILEDEIDEGLHLKIPFWQQVYKMDARTQEYTMSIATAEGNVYGDDSIDARSKDGQLVKIDATIRYHIDRTKADWIKQNLGTEEEYKRIVIRPGARRVMRDLVAKYNALDLVSEVRTQIVDEMEENLRAEFAEYNILLNEVVLRNVTFSEDFSAAIEAKQVEFQKIKAAEYQKDQAEFLKEKRIIEAQGEAESINLKGDALRANPSVIQYEFVQKMADDVSWGILPDGAVPFLDLKGGF